MSDAEYDAALNAVGWTKHHREQKTTAGTWGSFANCEDTVVEGWGKTLAEARKACLAAIYEREAIRKPAPA